jgi:hypothetical protein
VYPKANSPIQSDSDSFRNERMTDLVKKSGHGLHYLPLGALRWGDLEPFDRVWSDGFSNELGLLLFGEGVPGLVWRFADKVMQRGGGGLLERPLHLGCIGDGGVAGI